MNRRRRSTGLLGTILIGLGALVLAPGPAGAQSPRPTVGIAFGGGSARGIAHIGVIQWFEEHHIPIDTAAGTSMGGLIGGAFATGMPASELRAFVNRIDWDRMFGSSSFPFKNIRRKQDARSYPSRLEFGLKRGFRAPTSLNDGQQVDLLLAELAGPYYGLAKFDDLPTPFRVVAVDLRHGEKVVLDRGSFATALRSTMSLPAVFPPVERDGLVLVDGGALDNIPADVVRSAGANFVVAVDVGYAPTTDVNYSIFGLIGETTDAMMRSATRVALTHADLVIPVDVEGFGSLDWRRADELIDRGYKAAERHRDALLKYRVSDAEWQAWLAGREQRRKRTLPQPQVLVVEGIVKQDEAAVRRKIEPHLNVPFDVEALERDLEALTGLDRYQAVTWHMAERDGQSALVLRASEKQYAPPFLMLGLNIENTTSDDFRVTMAARYLAFDVLGSGSELRLDVALGADPSLGAILHEPIGRTRIYARPAVAARRSTFGVAQNGAIVAEYQERRFIADADLSVNFSKDSELWGGLRAIHRNDSVKAGDPGLPELSGSELMYRVNFLFDGQDSPVVPSKGTRLAASFAHTFDSPELPGFTRTNQDVTQASLGVSTFVSVGQRNRLFGVLTGGTSFDGRPLPTEQFTPGYPFVLDAFDVGERRGDHMAVLTLGGARQIARLPDFLGGPVFATLWGQGGSVFNTDEDADLNLHIGGGVILDTLVGPVLVGASAGVDGGWRTFFGIGRIFR